MNHRDIERHTICVLVDNEPGVLARVIGLFSGRGYNIDSLTVAPVVEGQVVSRINIVTSGTRAVIDQIKALLEKQVPVRALVDLTVEGPAIEREIALVKVMGQRDRLIDALRIAEFMDVRLVDRSPQGFVFEATGGSDHIDSFISLIGEPVEVSRGGVVAIARGEKRLEDH